MRERTRKINGALRIASAPGKGTEIELVIPGAYAFAPGGFQQHGGLPAAQAEEPI
jgi:hypothetical protein